MKKTGRKKYLRSILAVSVSAVMLFGTGLSLAANAIVAENTDTVAEQSVETYQAQRSGSVRVLVNGSLYKGAAFIEKSTTYVGIRQFSMLLGATNVSWEAGTKTATVNANGLTLQVRYGAGYMVANGRYLWLGNGSIIREGTMYVPIRVLCKAFGYEVEWSGSDRTASAVKVSGVIESGDTYYDSEELMWLSRIINAEAGSEPFSGKIAVGNVVLNRKNSPQFPGTVYGVIFDNSSGVQFTPTANGTIYYTPNADSVIAAKLCLEGYNILPTALFFINEKTAASSWVADNREQITVIGNHSFFA